MISLNGELNGELMIININENSQNFENNNLISTNELIEKKPKIVVVCSQQSKSVSINLVKLKSKPSKHFQHQIKQILVKYGYREIVHEDASRLGNIHNVRLRIYCLDNDYDVEILNIEILRDTISINKGVIFCKLSVNINNEEKKFIFINTNEINETYFESYTSLSYLVTKLNLFNEFIDNTNIFICSKFNDEALLKASIKKLKSNICIKLSEYYQIVKKRIIGLSYNYKKIQKEELMKSIRNMMLSLVIMKSYRKNNSILYVLHASNPVFNNIINAKFINNYNNLDFKKNVPNTKNIKNNVSDTKNINNKKTNLTNYDNKTLSNKTFIYILDELNKYGRQNFSKIIFSGLNNTACEKMIKILHNLFKFNSKSNFLEKSTLNISNEKINILYFPL